MATTHRDKDKQFGGQGQQFGGQGQEFGEQAKNIGATAMETAKETATGVMETAKGVASTAAKRAGDAASYVSDKAQAATSAAASGMKSLAGTIRERAPSEGVFGSASAAVAGTLEDSGRYLEEHGLGGVGEDLTDMIRRNPIPAVLIGIGIGFLVARATRS